MVGQSGIFSNGAGQKLPRKFKEQSAEGRKPKSVF
jgi:hypothetical protein